MNALILAEQFRILFAADPVFTGRACHNDQSCEDIVRPGLIFAADTKPLSQHGTAFSYSLTIWVEDAAEWPEPHTPPDPATVHAAAVQLARQKLFGVLGRADSETIAGAPAPRGELLQAALQAALIYDFRGYVIGDSQPGFETHHFRTPVMIIGCALSL